VRSLQVSAHRKHRSAGLGTLAAKRICARAIGRLDLTANGCYLSDALGKLCADRSALLLAVSFDPAHGIGMLRFEARQGRRGGLELSGLLLAVTDLLVQPCIEQVSHAHIPST